MATRISKQDRAEAIEQLRAMLKPGQNVSTDVVHVARSGMSRCIRVFVVHEGDIRDISWLCAKAGAANGWSEPHWACKMQGCGMDMGFALVYNLGRTLWPNGTPEPHGSRNGAPDSAGGYALRQRSL